MTILPKTKKISKDRDKSVNVGTSSSFIEKARCPTATKRLKHPDQSSSRVLSPPAKKVNRAGSQSPLNSDDEVGNAYRTNEEEDDFTELLRATNGWELKEMQGDGACLFRAVAHQVYGDQEMHTEVRRLCMDYMERNRDHFSQFITEDFDNYLDRKRNVTEHGNHAEVQAISEMYGRPVEIYQYRLEPINTFHPAASAEMNAPLRLSYHSNNHYNAIIDPMVATIGVGLGLPGHVPGSADADLITQAVHQSETSHLEEAMLNDKIHMTDYERTEEELKEHVARESYMEYLRKLDAASSEDKVNSKSPNRRRTPSNEETSSQKPSCSGTNKFAAHVPNDKPCTSKQAGLYEELLAMEDWSGKLSEDTMIARAILMSQQQFLDDMQKREHSSNNGSSSSSSRDR
ncbi:unnamed protein product [Auanema sp. JU1783]|nr:unnamed protein product [Auanema sp. JU1783]